ncbi:dicarboxylate/amino acid:cation symporter [Bermanella sp. WJH001]|uniref:dicarboxylate/amino acid:cation symporter n=1 Tax=Bermanella sp. WJH001 TaxID=3048005 RepID=UPI0024BF0576|nr:dicarboxylate/amino acid:cation symporter [Bermanella sp. WJH001]MDJ1538815.1 dicarboxylate/amino acid:cation symporter [Bermanella sp. WJH001]
MKHPHGLTQQILIAMVLAIILGACAQWIMGMNPWVDVVLNDWLVGGLFFIVGKVFVATLKLLVVPLVLVSLVCGAASLGSGKQLGRLGGKTLALYLFTTAVAISLAMGCAWLFEPGVGANLTSNASVNINQGSSFAQVMIDIFPSNPIAAMAEGKMLQIIVFALLLGMAMNHSGEAGQRIRMNFEDWNTVVLNLVTMLMKLAPYGVFALLFTLFARQGLSAIAELSVYFGTVVLVLLIQALLVYPAILTVLARLNPIMFLNKMRNVQLFAFSTASSNATLPVTMRTVEKRLGVDNRVASFSLPLGATLNMDGTAIMQGVATVFIAQAYGIQLDAMDFLTVIATATLASIGTAGVPGVGLVMLSMVLTQVGLPVEGIALIIGVDRLLDMMRTAVNVTGDATVTCVVAKSEQQLDEVVFNDPDVALVDEDVVLAKGKA